MKVKLKYEKGEISFDPRILILATLFLSSIVFLKLATAPTEETVSTELNATVNVYIDIVPTNALYPYGIRFGDVDPGTSNNPAENNSDSPTGGTQYNISVDPTSNVNVKFGNSLSATISGLTVKEQSSITNETHGFTTSYQTVDTTYDIVGNTTVNCTNIAPSNMCWMKYFLDVASATAAGLKTTTYKICGVQNTTDFTNCG